MCWVKRFFLLVLVSVASNTFAESPAWVLYERGVRLAAENRPDEALVLFRAAIARRGPFPEAEAAIGDVFRGEAAFELAVRQYNRALEFESAFAVPDDRFTVRYKLAELHYATRDFRAYESVLRRITDLDPAFSGPDVASLRESYRTTITTRGFDQLTRLYRIDDGFSWRAHSELGVFYVETGRYEQALSHLIYSTLMTVTPVIEEIRRREVDYEFTTVSALLRDIARFPALARFAADRELYKNLHFLANSLYGVVEWRDHIRSLWAAVSTAPNAGEWAARASEQLRSPRLEIRIDGVR